MIITIFGPIKAYISIAYPYFENLLLWYHQIKRSHISIFTKSYLFRYYNYIKITNIKKKLVNDDPNSREAKITELKKNTSLSSHFSLEVKLCTQVIFLMEINGEGSVYTSLD